MCPCLPCIHQGDALPSVCQARHPQPQQTCSKAGLVNRSLMGCLQVFLLPKQKPDEVLKKLWGNLHAAMKEGDHQAEQALHSLRLIAAGGDGTISWILQAVRCGQLVQCMHASTGGS